MQASGTTLNGRVGDQGTHETTRPIGPLTLQAFAGGSGSLLLVLHDYEYVNGWWPYLDALARDYAVLAPSHPGFGTSPLPKEFDTLDDLVYVYLDLLREYPAGSVNLLGLGFGGWIAAELAVRCTHQLKSLVLVDALGIKVGDRTTRDIADTFVVGAQEILDLTWHDPAAGARSMILPGLGEPTQEELLTVLRQRQTTALLAWKPFMHNPKLRSWLHRIDMPTLVLWGEADRLVTPAYGRAFAESIPGATFRAIANAGHYPYLEQPEQFVSEVQGFVARTAARTAS